MSPRAKQWLLIFATWTALALLAAASNIAQRSALGMTFDASDIYLHSLVDWYTCAVFTPAIFAAVTRAATPPVRVVRVAAMHAAGAAFFIVARLGLFVLVSDLLHLMPPGRSFMVGLRAQAFPGLLTYAAVAGVGYALVYSRRSHDRELRAQQLEASLASAQLHALRVQLQPHFLFNALNALSVLIHDDPDAADRMAMRLGNLLRRVIRENDRQLVPLREEIDLTQQYIEVMQIRIGDRLTVSFDVDEAALDSPVPPLILQPLVENAFKHGVGGISGPAEILLRAGFENGRLEIAVVDNGPGAAAFTDGSGLANIRLRLSRLFGDNASLDVSAAPAGGTISRITLPAGAA